MKFAQQLEEYSSWQWRGQYFNYQFLKKCLGLIADNKFSAAIAQLQPEQATAKGSFPKSKPWRSPALRSYTPNEEASDADNRQEAIDMWICRVESEAMRVGNCIQCSLQEHRDHLKEILDMPKDPVTQASMQLRVLDALGQLEEQVGSLRGFAEINHAALFKILKKHDKLVDEVHKRGLGEHCPRIAQVSGLGDLTLLDDLTEEVRAECKRKNPNPCCEQLSPAAARLAAGLGTNGSGSIAQLRRERYLSFFLGMCVALLGTLALLCVLPPKEDSKEPEKKFNGAYFLSSFCVFRVVLSITVCFWGMGVVAYVCESYLINHLFILDVHPRCRVGPQFLFSKAAVLNSLWIVFFGMYVVDYKWMVLPALGSGFNLRSSWHFVLYPVIMLLLSCVVLLAPSRVCRRTYGWQICHSIKRTCLAPFFKVTFGDNLVGDVMTSLTKPLQDIPASVCYIMSHHPQTDASVKEFERKSDNCPDWEHLVILPLIAALPLLFRWLQCLRRFWDTSEGKHLCNSGKYAASLFVVGISAMRGPDHIGVICISILATVYAASWDILMDWGLTFKDLSSAPSCCTEPGSQRTLPSTGATTTLPSTEATTAGATAVSSAGSSSAASAAVGAALPSAMSSSALGSNPPVTQNMEGGASLLHHQSLPSVGNNPNTSHAKRRHFSPQFYWMAVMFDIVARFSWAATLVPITLLSDDTVWRALFQVSMSILEIARRCVWVILRIENEQVTNASGYRALLWVPTRQFQVQMEAVAQEPGTMAAAAPAETTQPPPRHPKFRPPPLV